MEISHCSKAFWERELVGIQPAGAPIMLFSVFSLDVLISFWEIGREQPSLLYSQCLGREHRVQLSKAPCPSSDLGKSMLTVPAHFLLLQVDLLYGFFPGTEVRLTAL